MKTRTLYHLSHTDLDGYGCQFITKNFFEGEKHFYNTDYGDSINEKINEIFGEILKDRKQRYLFLITDLNIEMITAKKINNLIRGNKDIDIEIQLIDHHITGKEIADCYEWYHLDIEKCATKLTFEWAMETFKIDTNSETYFYYKNFSDIVNAHDLWLENVEWFNKGNYIADLIFNFIKYPEMFLSYQREHIFYVIKELIDLYWEGKNIQEVQSKIYDINLNFLKFRMNKDIWLNKDIPYEHKFYRYIYELLAPLKDNFKIFEINGYKGKFIYNLGGSFFQYVSNYYLHEQKDVDFLVHVKRSKSVSLRSKGDINVSEIARDYFNGGGHKNAAGGNIEKWDDFHSQEELESIIKRKIK